MGELWEWGNEGLGSLAALKQLSMEEHWLYHFRSYIWYLGSRIWDKDDAQMICGKKINICYIRVQVD